MAKITAWFDAAVMWVAANPKTTLALLAAATLVAVLF
jgi:hypothetical protein